MEVRARPAWGRAILAVKPTREGALVFSAGMAFVLFAWGGTLASADRAPRGALYAGAALLLGLYAVGHLGAAWALRNLRVSWECPSRVFAAEPFPVLVTVRNEGRLAVTGLEFPEEKSGAVLPAAEPGRAIPFEIRTRIRRRGRRNLIGPTMRVAWPLGLAAAEIHAEGDREVLAYPWRVPVALRDLRAPLREASVREPAAAIPRGGDLFRGLRGWTSGDPPKAIAWRASARHGRLLSREFEREDAGRSLVVLDADTREFGRDRTTAATALEQACALAASLVLRLRAAGRRTAFAAFTPDPVFVPSVAEERGLGRALEAMALLRAPSPREPRRDPLSVVPAAALRGARVILVTAGAGAGRTRRLPGGTEVVTVRALRATLVPEEAR
jgi:uncharacterized protein (DUF58 family)